MVKIVTFKKFISVTILTGGKGGNSSTYALEYVEEVLLFVARPKRCQNEAEQRPKYGQIVAKIP